MHPAIKTQTAEEIIYQILAGTARRSVRLPYLSKVRFTLQKAHGRLYELRSIYDLFARVSRNSPSADIVRLTREREVEWKREIGEGEEKQREGLRYLERVRAEVVSLGLAQVATALVYSDYIAKNKMLFVRLDESLRGRLIGRSGATIKQIQDRVGVTIKFEKLSVV
jgi:rRNA processing protein Krr1/Pno1